MPFSMRSGSWRRLIFTFTMRDRPDTLTFVATIVGERIDIDVFEDDHIEISRFRGDESIEGGKELLLQLVTAELRENYPEELSEMAAK
jgi:hypothetical protein